jgi:hypothetical protein
MEVVATILEIVKYIVPALMMIGITYLFLKKMQKSEEIKADIIRNENITKTTIPVRIQAYERMTLFLERINPSNLILRLKQPEMNAADLHSVLLFSIRQEYEHNLSQQLYISAATWQLITMVKDQLINEMNQIYMSAPPSRSSMDYSKEILNFYIEKDEPMPTQRCLDVVKNEFNLQFS